MFGAYWISEGRLVGSSCPASRPSRTSDSRLTAGPEMFDSSPEKSCSQVSLAAELVAAAVGLEPGASEQATRPVRSVGIRKARRVMSAATSVSTFQGGGTR